MIPQVRKVMERLQLLEFATIRKHCYGSVKNHFISSRFSVQTAGMDGESLEDLQEPGDGSLRPASGAAQ